MNRFLMIVSLLFALSGLGHAESAQSVYLIGSEDVLDISVWKEADLQSKVVVRPDGRISFPLVGEVQAAGRSLEDLQQDITQRLKKYIPDPVVTVLIDKVAGYKIYVIGQVKNSGQYVVGQYLDVMQALALAGGLTPYADANKVKILRRENGVQKVIPFEYADVEKGNSLSQNIILKSGDVVMVP